MGTVERNSFRSTPPRPFGRARRAIHWPLVFALVAAIAPRSVAVPGGDLPKPIPTRQSLFSIPFTIPAGAGDAEPVEVRLYVSADMGQNWSIAARVDPKQTSFTYRAARDGEYWFVIRTVDKQGRLKPENAQGPELRVIVDSMAPRLELHATRTGAGDVSLHWLAVDPLLKADTLRIAFQSAGEQTWHDVQFDPPRDDPNRSTATGDVTWPAPAGAKISIRAEIQDRAGNLAVSDASVSNDAASRDGPALQAPASGLYPAGTPINRIPLMRPSAEPTQNGERHDLTAGATSPFTSPAQNAARSSPSVAAQNSAGWPADQVSDRPLGELATRAAPSVGGGAAIGPSTSTNSRPVATLAGDTHAAAGDSRINPPGADRVAPQPTVNPFTEFLPPGERPYMVHSRKFALEYEVESVGPSGIAKIEIWGTRDGGRSWASYGLEPGQQGPVRVSVEGEGLYGFRITVQDGAGLSGKPPKSGDLPELWVGVDLTKPLAKLTATELGSGQHAGELAIRWDASDAMLAARPVTLLFAERTSGPWTTIAAGLENSGFYAWKFDNRVPEQVYLRLEVRDEAGNLGEYQTVEPVSLTGTRPLGHLRSVRPLDDESARVQMYHFYR